MGIKGFNQSAPNFINKFGRAASGDSTGLDAFSQYVAPTGMTATGGTTIEYQTSPGDVYKSHTFTSPGAFSITELATGVPNNVDLMVIGAGGGGGDNIAGGGGAGGARVFTNVPVSTGPYPVTIGAGGATGSGGGNGSAGGATTFALI